MGTGTLFVHKNKAAASCRTPSASRLPTPTPSAAAREKPSGSPARSNGAIWGQTRSWLEAPQAAPWRRGKGLTYHNQDQKAFSFPRKRGTLAAMGCSVHRAKPRPVPVRAPPLSGKVSWGWELVWQRCVESRDGGTFPVDRVAPDIPQPGVAESPRGCKSRGASPVRRFWFRLRRAGKYAG